MLAVYAVHGYGREAMKLFESMLKEGGEPDHVTFTHLLSACSHSGLVEEGKNYFNIMPQVYGIEPRLDHYSCMVGLLGRSGLLNDAYELIRRMPMEPNSGVWGAFFSVLVGFMVMLNLGRKLRRDYFLWTHRIPETISMLSNIYSAAGSWRDASKARALMKDKGLIRNPGCSFIEHGFVVGDQSHPDSDKIYTKLEEVIGKIREAGFVSETECVLHDVGEAVKEDMISKHSEKLAIALGSVWMQGRKSSVSPDPYKVKEERLCRERNQNGTFYNYNFPTGKTVLSKGGVDGRGSASTHSTSSSSLVLTTKNSMSCMLSTDLHKSFSSTSLTFVDLSLLSWVMCPSCLRSKRAASRPSNTCKLSSLDMSNSACVPFTQLKDLGHVSDDCTSKDVAGFLTLPFQLQVT